MEHSSRGCLHYFLVLPELYTTKSGIQAQEEVLDPCLHLGFLHQIKESVRLDEQRLIRKSSAGCFLLPVESSQSSLTFVLTSLASYKSLSLVNLVWPLHWFWWDVREIHIQLKPVRLIPVMEAWLDKVVHQEIFFKRRLYSTHLQCKNMIYLLSPFWNNFLNLTLFLLITQIANCRCYWVINNGRCWLAWNVSQL